jgi:hypothetical protein
MVIDPTTPLGKIRLRIGDWSDLPILPDYVIASALADCNNSVPRASVLCAQYVLATLTAKTHKRLAQVETWSNEQFENYVTFLKMTVLNPNLAQVAPVPYVGDGDRGADHTLIEFVKEWNTTYGKKRYYSLY